VEAHYWAHELQKFGHQVKMMAPKFIRPYVKNNKNDTRDAEAICEVVTRPTMRFVPVKSRAQLDVQAVHRVRQQVVRERAALANQLRGFLAEHGIVIRKGFAAVKTCSAQHHRGQRQRTERLDARADARPTQAIQTGRGTAASLRRASRGQVQQDERCQRLAELPGVGPLTATAVVASVGNAREFRSGRELAAFFGLVPRHRASGRRTVMLPIGRRCDHYPRMLMVQGARAVAALHRTPAGSARRLGQSSQVEARLLHRRGGDSQQVSMERPAPIRSVRRLRCGSQRTRSAELQAKGAGQWTKLSDSWVWTCMHRRSPLR
jgi:transposase